MARQIKNAAVVTDVVDVSLLGTADLSYWQYALKAEQLEPIEHEGNAQILIIAADAKYMGLRFRELSIAVFARDVSGLTNLSGSFLIRAFNSRRSFAWVERTIFKTPYYFGDISVQWETPLIQLKFPSVNFEVRSGQGVKMNSDRMQVLCWHGPVFLPSKPGTAAAKSKLFFAQVIGATEEFAFYPTCDVLTLPESAEHPFQVLRESGFRPTKWWVRPSAQHTKSKTYSRGDCPPYPNETLSEVQI